MLVNSTGGYAHVKVENCVPHANVICISDQGLFFAAHVRFELNMSMWKEMRIINLEGIRAGIVAYKR